LFCRRDRLASPSGREMAVSFRRVTNRGDADMTSGSARISPRRSSPRAAPQLAALRLSIPIPARNTMAGTDWRTTLGGLRSRWRSRRLVSLFSPCCHGAPVGGRRDLRSDSGRLLIASTSIVRVLAVLGEMGSCIKPYRSSTVAHGRVRTSSRWPAADVLLQPTVQHFEARPALIAPLVSSRFALFFLDLLHSPGTGGCRRRFIAFGAHLSVPIRGRFASSSPSLRLRASSTARSSWARSWRGRSSRRLARREVNPSISSDGTLSGNASSVPGFVVPAGARVDVRALLDASVACC